MLYLSLALILLACSDNPKDEPLMPSGDPPKQVKMLVVGNSFSYDALGYLPAIINKGKPDMDFVQGIAMDGSQTIQGHYEKAVAGDIYTRYSKWDNSRSGWKTFSNRIPPTMTLADVLADEDWDVIVFHQASNLCLDYQGIKDGLQPLVEWIRGRGYTGKMGWLITPAFVAGTSPKGLNRLQIISESLSLDHTLTSDEMANRLLDISRQVMKDFKFDPLLPCGTAIQVGRHTTLSNFGDWAPEDGAPGQMVFNDGLHLQLGIGNYVEACAAALVLTHGTIPFTEITPPLWPTGDRMAQKDEKGKDIVTGMDAASQQQAW